MSSLKIYYEVIEYSYQRLNELLKQVNKDHPCEKGLSWQLSENGKLEKREVLTNKLH